MLQSFSFVVELRAEAVVLNAQIMAGVLGLVLVVLGAVGIWWYAQRRLRNHRNQDLV